MTILAFDEVYAKKKVQAAFPDMFGMTDSQIAALPPYVQYFKCEDQVEAGEPGCDTHKFNTTICKSRNGIMSSWHPGWKYHALLGHMMAFTILQIITEALQALIALEPKQPETLPAKLARLQGQLDQLDSQEQADYEKIFRTPLPPNILQHLDHALWTKDSSKETNQQALKHMSLEMFIKDAALCHTAMLPSEIRYQGLLTDTFDSSNSGNTSHSTTNFIPSVLHSAIQTMEHPDPKSGMTPKRYVDPNTAQPDNMLIVTDDKEHQTCPEQLNIDFKDYFMTTSLETWRYVRLPNKSQKAYYTEFDMGKSKGWIFICMTKCKRKQLEVWVCGYLSSLVALIDTKC